MKKIIFGIFAHPDDEAFLCSGSFLKWVDEGADLHLIRVTRGENGQNPDGAADLGAVRENEWRTAGNLLGASTLTQLGYTDGGLKNSLFHEISETIQGIAKKTVSSYTSPPELAFVTYENCGITGHLDHIAVSFITSHLFLQMKAQLENSRLLYACACEATSPASDISFVFMPRGHAHAEIDLTIDAGDVLTRKKRVMRAHHSQRADAEAIIMRLGSNLAYEHFNYFKD